MFDTISYIFKYIFILIMYLFIFGVMRLIYLDIKSMRGRNTGGDGSHPYLKLLNRREHLNFKVEESYTLDKDLSIGRVADNNITIADPFLSKRHAKLSVRKGNVYLEDQNSKNGTFLNGKRLERGIEAPLQDGDKIRLGNIEFLFIKAQSEPQSKVQNEV